MVAAFLRGCRLLLLLAIRILVKFVLLSNRQFLQPLAMLVVQVIVVSRPLPGPCQSLRQLFLLMTMQCQRLLVALLPMLWKILIGFIAIHQLSWPAMFPLLMTTMLPQAFPVFLLALAIVLPLRVSLRLLPLTVTLPVRIPSMRQQATSLHLALPLDPGNLAPRKGLLAQPLDVAMGVLEAAFLSMLISLVGLATRMSAVVPPRAPDLLVTLLLETMLPSHLARQAEARPGLLAHQMSAVYMVPFLMGPIALMHNLPMEVGPSRLAHQVSDVSLAPLLLDRLSLVIDVLTACTLGRRLQEIVLVSVRLGGLLLISVAHVQLIMAAIDLMLQALGLATMVADVFLDCPLCQAVLLVVMAPIATRLRLEEMAGLVWAALTEEVVEKARATERRMGAHRIERRGVGRRRTETHPIEHRGAGCHRPQGSMGALGGALAATRLRPGGEGIVNVGLRLPAVGVGR